MSTLRFIHMSDTHISHDPGWESFGNRTLNNSKALVKYLNTELPFEPDFVLHTGDVVYNPDRSAYEKARDILSELRYPIYYVRGNHDDPDMMREFLPNLPAGSGRLDYDFMIGEFHFVILDTFGNPPTTGLVEQAQLEWLENKLSQSPARSIIFALHYLPVQTGVPVLDQKMIIQNHDALLDVLYPHRERLRCTLFGHIHRTTIAQRGGILFSSAPAVWFQLVLWPEDEPRFKGDRTALPGFNLVTVDHEQTWITNHTIPKP